MRACIFNYQRVIYVDGRETERIRRRGEGHSLLCEKLAQFHDDVQLKKWDELISRVQ